MARNCRNASFGVMNTSAPRKFNHPDVTARGEARASVAFRQLETLWINTGTLCNIECANCYIHSSPTEDRLSYITAAEAAHFLDETAALALASGSGLPEIGFTGGEPFMNPDMLAMAEDGLARGHKVLILTNAMQPMLRPGIKQGLLALRERYDAALTLRVSLDHYTEALHSAADSDTHLRAHETGRKIVCRLLLEKKKKKKTKNKKKKHKKQKQKAHCKHSVISHHTSTDTISSL